MPHHHHDERPPSALAHGATKSSDIEHVRRELGWAEEQVVRELKAAARYHWKRVNAAPERRAPS